MVGDGATAVYANFTGNSELSAQAAASTQRNLSTIAEASVDLAVDGAAAAIPGVPAGGTKALRALDKAEDVVKVAGEAGGVKKALEKGLKLVNDTKTKVSNVTNTTKKALRQGGEISQSKVGNYTKLQWTVKADQVAGQARAVYEKVINSNGKTVRMFKDTFDKFNNFFHRHIKK